jgi:hypothetical protein
MVNMGNIWDRTTEFLSDNARALLPIAVLTLLIPHAVRVLVGGAAQGEVNPLAAAIIGLVCVLIALWGQLAVVALALDPDGGRQRAAAAASRNYGRALGTMVLVFAVLLVLALPIGGVFAANGVDLAAMRAGGGMARANLSGGAAAFVSIYAVILSVMVFVAAIRLALLYPVIIAEGGTIAALRRSVALTHGLVWKMIGVWLLFAIVYIVAWLAVTSAIGVIVGLLGSSPSPFSFGRIVVAAMGGLVSMALALIVAAFSAKLYIAATASRESVAAA